MGNDEIFKACKEVLRSSETPTDYLRDTISRNFQKKKWIGEAFNLNEENDYRLKLDLPASVDNRKEEAEFLHGIERLTNRKYRFLDLNFMWEGKNKVRSTKVISNLWEDLLKTEDVNIKLLLGTHMDKQRFLCAFGDKIKNGREGWVSINPIDFFTMSGEDYCSFTSCVAAGSCYFNTVLHYLNSEGVIVSFSTEEGSKKKIGRQLIYLSNDMIIQGRIYGCFTNSDALLIRDHLQALLGGTWVKSSSDAGAHKDRIISDTSAYIDYGYGIFSYRKGSSPDPIIIEEGRCLSCGGYIGSVEEGGICEDCCNDHYSCDSCGAELSEDEYISADDGCYYCESCFNDRFFHCYCCGEVTDNEETVSTEDTGRDFCNDCAMDRLYCCDDCGNWYEKGANQVFDEDGDEKTVCNDCLTNYKDCDRCRNFYPNEVFVRDLCPSCLEEKESEEKSDES